MQLLWVLFCAYFLFFLSGCWLDDEEASLPKNGLLVIAAGAGQLCPSVAADLIEETPNFTRPQQGVILCQLNTLPGTKIEPGGALLLHCFSTCFHGCACSQGVSCKASGAEVALKSAVSCMVSAFRLAGQQEMMSRYAFKSGSAGYC